MSAKKQHVKAAEEAAALAEDNRLKRGMSGHQPQQVHTEAAGVELHAVAGRAFLVVDGVEVELSQTDVAGLLHNLQSVFQAVS